MQSVHRVSLILLAVFLCRGARAADDADPIRFNRDVRPILSEKCFFCHGPDANHREADLRLDIEAEAKEHAIEAGAPHESELVARVTSDDPELRMPPAESGKQLSAAEIETLRRWVEQGAPYEGHWSFVPPTRPPLPKVDDPGWAQSDLDRFVLARLDAEGLQPAAEAERHEWLRRVTLDLTGLPPTPDELVAFLDDPSPEAYEKVVDRLLQSPRYGEHMARFWLDAARYADTNGYQYDLEREQWVWRDWVIHAFNTNMPFDQFTVEQLAGDLLPDATPQQRLATAFHRNHPITIEGGVIDEEYRTEYVIDRVVTTSTVWLGLTMTCGRCHDHKYDPVSQREFYQFMAFFNNVPERGLRGFGPQLKVPSPLNASKQQRLEQQLSETESQLDALLAERQSELTAWEQQLAGETKPQWMVVKPVRVQSQGGATLVEQSDQSYLATGKNPATDVYEVLLENEAPVHAVRIEALTDSSFVGGGAGRASNGNFVLSEFQVAVSPAAKPDAFEPVPIAEATADYSQANYPVRDAIDGKIDRTGWAVDGNTKRENRSAIFVLSQPVAGERTTRLRVRMHFAWGGSHQIGRFRVALTDRPVRETPAEIAAVVSKPAEQRTEPESRRLHRYLADRFGDAALRAVVHRQQQLRAQQAEVQQVPATMVMVEMDAPRTTHVLERGAYDRPGEAVQAATPAALPAMSDALPANRLGLARWLVMPEHPLTARVTVNRFWQQLFGTGIVKTVEDFGAQGSWPSHPELLDWLAVEFVESGWDVQGLLKQIVLSATYRQSSRLTAEQWARDPENRLLARGPRLRLDAEVIRDSALFASGLLSDRLGGPSVFPYHPAGLWQEINNRPGYSRTYEQGSGEDLYRRSLYTFWKRTVPPPSMAAFDAPEREFCVVRRSRTNTPLQALVLLHDPQFVEAARGLALRVLEDREATDEQRIRHAFRLVLSRDPGERELEVLRQLVERRRDLYRAAPAAAELLLAVGESPAETASASTVGRVELAAWTTAARALLNTSEFVTKP